MLTNYVSIFIAVIVMIEGVYQIVTGKIYGSNEGTKNRNNIYTEESVAKCNKVSGICVVLIGGAYLLFKLDRMGTLNLNLPGMFWGLTIAILAILLFTVNKVMLKEKE